MADSTSRLSVVWYDPNVCEKEHEAAIEILQQSIGYVTMLKEKENADQYFGRDFSRKRSVVITTGQFGRSLLPKIHDQPGVISIYIYCEDVDLNKEWTKEYSKVGRSFSPTCNMNHLFFF